MPDQLQNDNEQENGIAANPASSANAGNSNADETKIYSGHSSLETRDEFENDKKSSHKKEDNSVTASA